MQSLIELSEVLLNFFSKVVALKYSTKAVSVQLYESSKRPAPFVEMRNAELKSGLRENHEKGGSVEKQPPECSIKKTGLKNSPYSQESTCVGASFI